MAGLQDECAISGITKVFVGKVGYANAGMSGFGGRLRKYWVISGK
jgi:hypothetical protein